MNFPTKQSDYADLKEGIKQLNGNVHFDRLVAWLRSELEKRDIENRQRGCENKTTEAETLAVILSLIPAK